MRRRMIAVATGLAVLIVGLGAVLADARTDSHRAAAKSTHTAASAQSSRKVTHKHVSQLLLRHFVLFRPATLRHAHTAGAATVPAAVEDLISKITDPLRGGDPDVGGAQPVAASTGTSGSAATIWVVPGSSGVCIVAQETAGEAVGTCQSATVAVASGVDGLLQNPDGSETLFGLVPNGNAAVTVATGSGQRTPSVSQNVFAATVPSTISAVTLRNGAGDLVRVAAPAR